MANEFEGTTILKDEHGRAYGRLESATGRLYGMDGKFVRKLEAHGPSNVDPYPEDGDLLMSDHAARHAYKHIALANNRKSVTMKDASGKGVQVNMDLGIADVHIASSYPGMAGGYSLAEGVADTASPVMVVPKNSDYYRIWDSANAFKRVMPNIGTPGAPVGEVNPTLSNTKFSCIEYALGAYIPTEIEANADAPLRPYEAAVERVMNALRLEREIRVATLLATAGNWTNALALAAGAQWNGGASSDPVANLHYIKENSYAKISKWIFSEPAYDAFVRNPAVRAYWATGTANPVIPKPEEIAALLKIAPIILADMKYTSGGNPTYAWPSVAGSASAVVALHDSMEMPPTSQKDVMSSGTFRWAGGSVEGGQVTAGIMVRSYFDPRRGARAGRALVMCHSDIELIFSKIVGGVITGVIQ